MSATPTPVLRIEGLRIALPDGADRAWAVEGVDLSIAPGEVLCLVGESGSGKTVCAHAALGLLPEALSVQSGRVLLEGRDILALAPGERRALRGNRVAMVFQEPMSALNPLMPVGEQIAEVLRVHGVSPRAEVDARVHELLTQVGLPEPATLRARLPFQLSGGQRQRVVIAMALALEPALLIADEPTTALDVTTQAQILALIRGLQRRMGMAVLFVTHDFGVVAEMADRVAVMRHGRIVEQGTVDAVLRAPAHPYTRALIDAAFRTTHLPPADVDRSAPPLLTVDALSVRLGATRPLLPWRQSRRPASGVQALDGVSFELRRGETLGIVGESGSGKSTLGRCLLRLLRPDAGRIVIAGTDIGALPERALRPLRPRWQMVFQDPQSALNPHHTVGHGIERGLLASGMSRAQAQQEARGWLEDVGLDANAYARYPAQFSGGQRQRIVIARALALRPQLLVADEPVSALDVTVQAQILELLRALQQRLSLAMVFITHDLRVAAQLCHRIAVMQRGQIVEQGPAQELLTRPVHAYTQQLIAAVPGLALSVSGRPPPAEVRTQVA
ncbi:ABC transporter ATP-binding protein [Variovorax boronicumulans]|uniref:ABC transporter ATP-binding protein n=1 Tax=Variovorax boronicumulans TaxID=436515 RepID=UPI001C59076D